nr:response regulator [Methylomarinum sp. Ch1-1]MDP4521875.1 response regulator [Methylomarinum sp. Ch1-1]
MISQINVNEAIVKILLVEDESDALEIMGRYLRRKNFETVLATDEAQALAEFDKNPPDLVVSDLCLKQGSGLTLYKNIFSRNSDIPFILVSAYVDKDILLEAFQLGIDMVLPKPIRMQKLIETISELQKDHANVKRLERELSRLSKQYSQSQHYLTHIEDRARRLLTPIRDLSQNVKYFSKPAGAVSGDLFSEYNDRKGLHYLFLADSAGHGVDATMPALFIPARFTELAKKASPSNLSPTSSMKKFIN